MYWSDGEVGSNPVRWNEPWQKAFSEEIDLATPETNPHIHGLLKVLAYNISRAPNNSPVLDIRAQQGAWDMAKICLKLYVDDLETIWFSGLRPLTLEKYLEHNLRCKASDSFRNHGGDQDNNWFGAVNNYADWVIGETASNLFERRAAA